jgi:hypothetical protein
LFPGGAKGQECLGSNENPTSKKNPSVAGLNFSVALSIMGIKIAKLYFCMLSFILFRLLFDNGYGQL